MSHEVFMILDLVAFALSLLGNLSLVVLAGCALVHGIFTQLTSIFARPLYRYYGRGQGWGAAIRV